MDHRRPPITTNQVGPTTSPSQFQSSSLSFSFLQSLSRLAGNGSKWLPHHHHHLREDPMISIIPNFKLHCLIWILGTMELGFVDLGIFNQRFSSTKLDSSRILSSCLHSHSSKVFEAL
ncbi:hypothetical protein AAC387_Pa11g1210 [Persea americana]